MLNFNIPWWMFLFVILPFNLFLLITWLPYYLFKIIGLGKFYKQKRHIVVEHVHQLILQPESYFKVWKGIHEQIVKESKKLK